MSPGRQFRPRRHTSPVLMVLAFALGTLVVAVALDRGLPWSTPKNGLGAGMGALPKVVYGLSNDAAGNQGGPISPGSIQVLDGDTIRTRGAVYRLVGFDTPESGSSARCERERQLAAAATRRLRQLVAGGGLILTRVRCACAAGTEGTQRCNFGRLCGTLRARGREVGEILIAEGLARRYVCGRSRCPPREPWC
jgi:endonuclease YncB( thermonuclease family)